VTPNGTAIRAIREAQRRSLRSVADSVGISPGYLSDLERGVRGAAPETIQRIARELAVPVDAIRDHHDEGTTDVDDLRLFTKEEVAELLNVSVGWLKKEAAARAIPCTYIGRSQRKLLRFSAQNIRDLIAAGDNDPATHGQRPARAPQRARKTAAA
jgi:transcriptional regulator with XRE-family HTH domain